MQGAALKMHSIIESNTRKITWVHCNLNIKRWWNQAFFSLDDAKNAYNKIEKIIFVSNDAMEEFTIPINNVTPHKEVFYNPINKNEIIAQAEEFTPAKKHLTICSIGRLEPQKAHDRLLRTVKKLAEEGLDFEVWILGSGRLEQDLKKLTFELGINDYVKFKGFQKNPYPYLKQADIFVNTSITEGFPLVVCEAVCLGKAIVATRVTGTTEILDKGEYGILTGYQDIDIFNALKTLIEQKKMRKNLEKKAKKRSEIFNIDQSMKQFEKIIND